jgi:ATP-binding cassette subfamily F protein uup
MLTPFLITKLLDNMSLVTLQSVKKDFGIKELLKDANFSLDTNDKVGLIGTNGSGKSTLLKMIAGLESIDSGQILVNSGAKIVYYSSKGYNFLNLV